MKMISIHEYELQPGSDPQRFEQAFRDAEARGLFDLPGLMAHHFVKGIKGARRNAYARCGSMKAARLGNGCGALWSDRGALRSIRRNGGSGKKSCLPPS